MNLSIKTERFLRRNASTILTWVGAAGVVGTAVLAVKATPKALTLLEAAKEEKGEDLTVTEKIVVAGPAYIPAVAVGASTIACVFGANILNKRDQAALMSAYALLDNSYREYKRKLEEIYGEEAGAQIREEIAQDHYVEEDIRASDEKLMFFDFYSMQFFESTMEEVLSAEYRFNQNFIMSGSACLNEFYDMVGLPRMPCGYQLGWAAKSGNMDVGISELEFRHEKIRLDDGMEGYIIVFSEDPVEDYIY